MIEHPTHGDSLAEVLAMIANDNPTGEQMTFGLLVSVATSLAAIADIAEMFTIHPPNSSPLTLVDE